MPSTGTKILRLLLVLILAPLAQPSASAGGQVGLEAFLGFDGHFRLNSWTPLSVLLDNRSHPIRGDLEVVVTSGSEILSNLFDSRYTIPVDLPENSKKRYQFTLRIDAFSHPLIIRLKEGQTVLASREINLKNHYTPNEIIPVVDSRVSADFLATLPGTVAVARVRPLFLPERWYGYQGIGLLILDSAVVAQLRENQYRALTQWIRRGGTVITNASANYGTLKEARVRRLWPLSIKGLKLVRRLSGLESFCGEALNAAEPFLVLDAVMPGGRVLAGEPDLAIVSQKAFGDGSLLISAVDYRKPPFSMWRGQADFWKRIMAIRPLRERPTFSLDGKKTISAMFWCMGLGFPQLMLVTSGVIGYLILIKVLFRLFQRDSGRRWRSVAMLTAFLLLVCTGGIFFYGKRVGERSFVYNSFAHAQKTGPAHNATVRATIGVYGLKQSIYGFGFTSGDHPVEPVLVEKPIPKPPADDRNKPTLLHAYQGGVGQRFTGVLRRWSHGIYRSDSRLACPIMGRAAKAGGQIRVTIDNRGNFDLADCLIYHRGRVFRGGEIEAGASLELAFTSLAAEEKVSLDTRAVDRFLDAAREGGAPFVSLVQSEIVMDLLLTVHDNYGQRPNTAVLLGWVAEDIMGPIFDQGPMPPKGEGATLLEMALAISG